MAFGMDPQDPVDDDVYTSAYCRCPGSGRHLMFPAIYHRCTSRVDVQLATSRDGLLWSRPGRQPILTRRKEDGDYGMVYAFPNLVPLSADEWGLMFIGQFDLHDWGNRHEPGIPPEWRWATWKGKSDLSALAGKAVSVRLHMARARVFSVAV